MAGGGSVAVRAACQAQIALACAPRSGMMGAMALLRAPARLAYPTAVCGHVGLASLVWSCTDTDLTRVLRADTASVPEPASDGGIAPSDSGAAPSDSGTARALRLRRLHAPELATRVTGCHLASPIAHDGGFIAAAANQVRSFSSTGALRWSRALPAPDGEQALVVATPVALGDELFVAYHTTELGASFHVNTERKSHRLLALDAATGEIDAAYEPLRFEHVFTSADGDPVPFRADRALGRSALAAAPSGGGTELVVSFGNARDLQPWHGFAFAVSVERWRALGAADALSGALIVTPESSCGPEGSSGSRERRCGGGLWAPSGPLLRPTPGGAELVFAPGNGQLDLARRDYANTLMRTSASLEFDPSCSSACDDFDPNAPSPSCAESCRDLFIPREAPGDPFPLPESGACDGLSLFQCWQALDYLGGSTPALIHFDGRELLVYPAKDGAAYLIDADHLGRQYDRRQLVAVCGTRQDPCRMDWAGMIVTEPAVVPGDPPLVIIPTFMPDRSHPAGVVALEPIAGPEGPSLRVAWRYPPFSAPEAKLLFREHPSRVALTLVQGVNTALVVDVRRGRLGRLLALRASDGELVAEATLDGPGSRFTLPLVLDERVVIPSCESDAGPSHLELFALEPESLSLPE